MPELSRFFGIVVHMYFADTEKHHGAHFHAAYGNSHAVFSLQGEPMEGHLPPKQTKLIAAWAALHETELQENWYLAQTTGDCYRIDPLN